MFFILIYFFEKKNIIYFIWLNYEPKWHDCSKWFCFYKENNFFSLFNVRTFMSSERKWLLDAINFWYKIWKKMILIAITVMINIKIIFINLVTKTFFDLVNEKRMNYITEEIGLLHKSWLALGISFFFKQIIDWYHLAICMQSRKAEIIFYVLFSFTFDLDGANSGMVEKRSSFAQGSHFFRR